MSKLSFFIPKVNSTNELMINKLKEENLPEGFIIYTDFQTAGKGQIGNHWEAENGKNLIFSLVLYPYHIAIMEQFILSEMVGLAILKTLKQFDDNFSIKWSNDIYWKDKKIAGMLIENSLHGNTIKHSIIGIGLNVNQESFSDSIPNPISLKNILNKNVNRKKLLQELHSNILEFYTNSSPQVIHQQYLENLYRKSGCYRYKDVASKQIFEAEIVTINPDGKLILATRDKEKKSYYFKEVEFLR